MIIKAQKKYGEIYLRTYFQPHCNATFRYYNEEGKKERQRERKSEANRCGEREGDTGEINEAVGEEYEEKQPAQSRAGSRGQDQVAERDAIWNLRIPREKERDTTRERGRKEVNNAVSYHRL